MSCPGQSYEQTQGNPDAWNPSLCGILLVMKAVAIKIKIKRTLNPVVGSAYFRHSLDSWAQNYSDVLAAFLSLSWSSPETSSLPSFPFPREPRPRLLSESRKLGRGIGVNFANLSTAFPFNASLSLSLSSLLLSLTFFYYFHPSIFCYPMSWRRSMICGNS